VTDRVDRFAPVAAGVFLFVLPITHTVGIRTVALGLLVLCAGYVWWRDRPPAPARSLLIGLGAWGGIAIASLAWTADFEYSQGEVRNEIVYPVAAFLTFYALTPDAARWRLWTQVLTTSAGVIALYAYVNFARHGDWYTKAYVGDRNAYSTYATLVAPVLLAAALDRELPRAWRFAAGAALVLTLGAGALTQNRIMWVALLVAALVLLAARFRWRAATGTTRVAATAAVLALGAAGGVQIALVSGQKSPLAPGGSSIATQLENDPRTQIWRYAADRIAERPWLGHGYGRGILRKDFRAHFEGNLLQWHGHNLFLNTAMAGGVVLLAALVAALAALAVALGRGARASPACAVALAVLAAALVKSLTDDVLIRENSLLLWSIAGMALGVAARGNPPDPAAPGPVSPRRTAARAPGR
jgi:O-antigen ligase